MDSSTLTSEELSKSLSSVKETLKTQLLHIIDLVVRLLTNASHAKQVSKGGEKGASSKMGISEDKGKDGGKIFSQSIPTVTIQTMATIVTTLPLDVDLGK